MTDPTKRAPFVAPGHPVDERLDSWKEIAAYMRRDVTTVQRWERREGMPVHRHVHERMGSVYAFRTELDAWARGRRADGGRAPDGSSPAAEQALPSGGTAEGAKGPAGAANGAGRSPAGERPEEAAAPLARRHRPRAAWVASALAACLAALWAWHLGRRVARPDDPLAGARFLKLTDFEGIEQAAAISPDGRFVAFQSNRDGRMDVWVTQIGTGQFLNLTRGRAQEIVNPSIRALGFSPDGTLVTYWVRRGDAAGGGDIGTWAVPLLGGAPRPYLEGVAEHDWSADGAFLAYHTAGPGDPTFVQDRVAPADRQVFSAAPGLHAHFPVWSPDRAFVYLVRGQLPDRLDIWRIRPDGGAAERITRHDSAVSHPVFVDERTLLYLATDADGLGPWIHSLDLRERTPRRASAGVEAYTSLAASRDGRRLVATVTTPKAALWLVPLSGARADLSAARRIALTTGQRSSPRLGPGFLLYVSSKGAGDAIWKLQDGTAVELWSAPETRVVGAPAIARDGRRVAFVARQGERTSLWAMGADGTGARAVATGLALAGAPAWAPDGRSITAAVAADGTPRLVAVPLDGRRPAALVEEHSTDPAWSPGGDLVVYSGADVGTTFGVKAAKADGSPHPLPALTLTRGTRHLAFTSGGRALVVLQGEIRHKNLWLVDLVGGERRPLTDLPPDFEVRDFDVSPEGREMVLEQVQEQSDLVLIERQAPAHGR